MEMPYQPDPDHSNDAFHLLHILWAGVVALAGIVWRMLDKRIERIEKTNESISQANQRYVKDSEFKMAIQALRDDLREDSKQHHDEYVRSIGEVRSDIRAVHERIDTVIRNQ